jgi:hypothetical protein
LKRDLVITVLLVLLMLALLLPVIWLVSTEEQRAQYRAWLGVDPTDDEIAKVAGPIAPPDWTRLLEPPRSARPAKSGLRHNDVLVCDATKVANPAKLPKADVYRWTDDQGRLHFSDQAPTAESATNVEPVVLDGRSRFSAKWVFDGFKPPALLRNELERTTDGVFRFFEHVLRLDDMAPLHVNLRVIQGRNRFLAYRNKKDPALTTDSGFYRFADNEAVVRWTTKETAIAVAQHEVAHLVVGNLLGDVPLWLNEGVAEVVERLSFSASGIRAEPDVEAVESLGARAAGGSWPTLRTFMSLSRRDWDKQGETFSYQYAWSLVHFLLEDSDRRDVLIDHVQALADQRCRNFDSVGFLDGRYPGGISGLERDWLRWLRVKRPQSLAL